MKYTEYLPGEKLQDIVLNYWQFEVFAQKGLQFPFEHNLLPEPTISLVFIKIPHFAGIRILGPQLQRFTRLIQEGSVYLGIRFQPWITIPELSPDKLLIINTSLDAPATVSDFFQQPLSEISQNETVKISDMEALLHSYLRANTIEKSNLVKYICLQLESGERVKDIVEQIPMSIRVIQKKFKATTGFTMKQYAVTRRQKQTWKELVINDEKFTDAIFNNGYFDQAHFINEFKRIMKKSHQDFYSYLNSIDHTIA